LLEKEITKFYRQQRNSGHLEVFKLIVLLTELAVWNIPEIQLSEFRSIKTNLHSLRGLESSLSLCNSSSVFIPLPHSVLQPFRLFKAQKQFAFCRGKCLDSNQTVLEAIPAYASQQENSANS